MAYKMYIMPTLEYASMVCDPHKKKKNQIDELKMVWRNAAEFILSS